jgi:hypothetical protein
MFITTRRYLCHHAATRKDDDCFIDIKGVLAAYDAMELNNAVSKPAKSGSVGDTILNWDKGGSRGGAGVGADAGAGGGGSFEKNGGAFGNSAPPGDLQSQVWWSDFRISWLVSVLTDVSSFCARQQILRSIYDWRSTQPLVL